jgi:dimethylamine/trimethylamine dehydrogenase
MGIHYGILNSEHTLMSDNPLDILFETVRIGPVTAPNRFYQVPHCNGMGYRLPRSLAAMRGIKAEGGWGVVCTEETEIHHTSDLSPNIEGRLWDDADIPALQLMTEAVHRHGSLAGIELTHGGMHASNLYSRTPSLAPRSIATGIQPGQSRRMDREDFRKIRTWHRQAALRAKRAGFDIIYCYASHDLSLAMHLLLPRYNDRTDEYGGSLLNRTRFLRELIEDTHEAVGDTCAVAVRLAVDELLGDEGLTSQGEGYNIIALLAELPDLWDVNLSGWSNDSATSRFEKEGFQERYTAFVKRLTSKPVVGVGRFTSPESMASAVRRGLMDLVGAARPSIADPFLPNKIHQGRTDDIRECIGCNICVTGDTLFVPIRCTQNPTMGEEWRRGWHPENIPVLKSHQEIAVIGAGPAGLECSRALAQRGANVTLLEARREPGGHVLLESGLPGLIEWRRVIDWRITQIPKLPNLKFYPSSPTTPTDVLEAGFKHVFIATGSAWRRDGIGRASHLPIPGHELPSVFTPDDLLSGRFPSGQVLIYDDDHYYMGGLLAELLVIRGCRVTLATPARLPSAFTQYTLEQERIEKRLHQLGVQVILHHRLASIQADFSRLTPLLPGVDWDLPCQAVVLVTDRLPQDALYHQLKPDLERGDLLSLRRIGDAEAPNIIAQAVYSGHLAAREFDEPRANGTPFKIELIDLT